MLVPYLVHAVLPQPSIVIKKRKYNIRLSSNANCKEPHKAWSGKPMRSEWMGGVVVPVATADHCWLMFKSDKAELNRPGKCQVARNPY